MTNRTPDQKTSGKMIAICSAVGGAGRTMVTVNLAAILAERNIRISILDGDLQFGDMALALDVKPNLTIKELVERNELAHIGGYLTAHKTTGIRLLAAPVRPEYADLITTDMLETISDSMLADTDILLVETQHGLHEQNLSLMEKADSILIVSTPGMAALKNTKVMAETLAQLGMKEKLHLVINKSTMASVIKAADIPELTQVDQASFLPDDPKYVPLSLDIGIPLATSNPKLPFSKAVAKMGEQLFPESSPAAKKKVGQGLGKKKGRKVSKLTKRGEKDEFISQAAIENTGGNPSS